MTASTKTPVKFRFEKLSPNPKGVINRVNGCGSTVAEQTKMDYIKNMKEQNFTAEN
jgi:hypothetical protein